MIATRRAVLPPPPGWPISQSELPHCDTPLRFHNTKLVPGGAAPLAPTERERESARAGDSQSWSSILYR
eukprot:COSAG01_NODE_24_length_37608_cov_19.303154_23_plen_69_part_00